MADNPSLPVTQARAYGGSHCRARPKGHRPLDAPLHSKQLRGAEDTTSLIREGEIRMSQLRIPAAFIRGGTSKAVVLKRTDLPTN